MEKTYYFFIILIFLFDSYLLPQTPHVVEITPSFNEIAATGNPQITAVFDVSMDSSSFSNISFAVFGERSGYHNGSIFYSEENKSVTFNSHNKFSAGERVNVCLSNKILSKQGDTLNGFQLTFRIPTAEVGLNFSEPVEYGGGGFGLSCIDMNNDGYPDIVSSSGAILINNGKGEFPTNWSLDNTDGFYPIIANDFNQDGYMDAFYGGNLGLTLALRNEVGDFSTHYYPWYWHYYVSADLNGDGFPDIAGVSDADTDPENTYSAWSILFNNGSGAFQDTIFFKIEGGGSAVSLLPSDIDNDGDIDIIIASRSYCCGPNLVPYGLDGIIVGRNNGQGIFDQYQLYSSDDYPDINFPEYLCVDDFDNNGYADIAVLGYSGTVLLNSGDGTFSNNPSSIRPFWSPEQGGRVTCGDVNGDGWIDIAVSGYQFPFEPFSDRKYGILSNYNGYFFNTLSKTLPNSYIYSNAFADFDGDMDLDLVHCGTGIYISFNKDTVTSVSNYKIPQSFSLYQNYPNPFNNETTINFELNKPAVLHLIIYNILGEEVSLLKDEFFPTGAYKVVWKGKDDHGNDVNSGVYYLRAHSSESTQIIKILFLK